MGEALSQRMSDLVMVAQQVARGEDQIVEIELSARPFLVAIAFEDRARFGASAVAAIYPRAWRA